MKRYILIPLILVSFSLNAKTLYKASVLNMKIEEIKNELVITYDDVVMHPMFLDFKEVENFLSEEKRTIRLKLNSGGGSKQEGLKVIALFRKLKEQGHTLITEVLNGRMCGSMCVPIYMLGDQREAGKVSTFMFHGIHTRLNNVPKKKETRELFNMMIEDGMNSDFVDYLYQEEATTTPGEYWLSAKELDELSSGVITKLKSRHIKYKRRSVGTLPRL